MRSLCSGLICIFLTTATFAQDDVEKETKKLEGKWKVVSSQLNGTTIPLTAYKNVVVEFKDAKLTFAEGGKVYDEIDFEIDPAAKPKQIDYRYILGLKKGLREAGIYDLDGDSLTICSSPRNQKRPSEFKSPAGQGIQLLKLKRAG